MPDSKTETKPAAKKPDAKKAPAKKPAGKPQVKITDVHRHAGRIEKRVKALEDDLANVKQQVAQNLNLDFRTGEPTVSQEQGGKAVNAKPGEEPAET